MASFKRQILLKKAFAASKFYKRGKLETFKFNLLQFKYIRSSISQAPISNTFCQTDLSRRVIEPFLSAICVEYAKLLRSALGLGDGYIPEPKAVSAVTIQLSDAQCEEWFEKFMGFYELVSPDMHAGILSCPEFDMRGHLAAVASHGMQLWLPTDNQVVYSDILARLKTEPRYKDVLSVQSVIRADLDSNIFSHPVTYSYLTEPLVEKDDQENHRLFHNGISTIALEKTARDWTQESSSSLNSLRVHVPMPGCLLSEEEFANAFEATRRAGPCSVMPPEYASMLKFFRPRQPSTDISDILSKMTNFVDCNGEQLEWPPGLGINLIMEYMNEASQIRIGNSMRLTFANGCPWDAVEGSQKTTSKPSRLPSRRVEGDLTSSELLDRSQILPYTKNEIKKS